MNGFLPSPPHSNQPRSALQPLHTAFCKPCEGNPQRPQESKKMGVLFSQDFKMYINYYQSLLPDEWSGFYLPYKAEALRHTHTRRTGALSYTGCPRRNVPDFGMVFLMLKYTDITQNTYVQSLNGYGDNGQRKVWSSGGSTHCTLSAESLSMSRPCV